MSTRGAVAIVRHSFYPFELNVKREAEALLADGFDVHVICLRNKGEAAEETIEGVHVYRLPVGHRRGKVLRYLWEYNAFFVLASLKLARMHRKAPFVAVQVNTMPDYLVFAAFYPRRTGARVVLHLHEPIPELFATMFAGSWYTPAFVWLTRQVEQISIRFADRVLTVTDQMRDNIARRGADVEKVTVIVNVPDDRHFQPARWQHLAERVAAIKREERARGVFRILTHGAIESRYGYDTLVRAVARVHQEVPGVQFRFMGSGDYLHDVQRMAENLAIADCVQYLGFVPFEQMIEEILLADACVVAVKENPYSVLVHTNKMYEYMALRRPVVASRLDSVVAYFPEDSVRYFAPGSDESLTAALLDVWQNPDAAEQRVERASAIYETCRWEKERQRYLSVYQGL